MSTVITDNLTGKTAAGNVTITSEGGSATMQLQQGLAKAFACVDNEVTTTISTESFNIASTTDNGTGDFSLTWTSSMNSTPYAFGQICHNNQGDAYARGVGVYSTASSQQTPNGMTTGSCRFRVFYSSSSASAGNAQQAYNALTLHGDLA